MDTEPAPHDFDSDLNAAAILSKALPYMLRYADRTVVVKYGGHAMGSDALTEAFAQDITLLKLARVKPIVVHGGGPQIARQLDRLGIVSRFEDGLRVTDKETVDVVEMVLAGAINKDIVRSITGAGGRAIGLCGKDGNMVTARKLRRTATDPDSNIERIIDLGFVGEPEIVRTDVIETVADAGTIPVIAPVAADRDGQTYNINADTFAGAVAGAMRAKRLLFLTDVPGVLDKSGNLIRSLSRDEARNLINDGTISGGMIPKVETCLDAMTAGVEAVVILNGKVPHAVLLELFTETGAGTLITR